MSFFFVEQNGMGNSNHKYSLAPNNLAPDGGDFSARNGGDAFGVEMVLGGMNALVQAFGRVVIENGDALLPDDGTSVHAGIHEMNGAAGDFDAVVEGLFPGFEAGKRR